MRLFMASFATETNTFAPFPTGLASFEENGLTRDASRTARTFGGPALKVFRQRAEALGWDVVESLTLFAQPASRVVRSVYERFRDEILDDLAAARPVDVVLLMLHGAMVADGYDDCEGDILERVRRLAPQAVIGCELDPHCHLTSAMVRNADVITIFKEYPHIDVLERAEDLFELCRRVRLGEVAPVAALVEASLVGTFPTFEQPMRGIVDSLAAAETRPEILSASIAHGFPWGDVEDVGARVLVYADGDASAAGATALAVSGELYAQRKALAPRHPDVAASLDRAATLDGRVVIGDYSDNPGGGAPGDSTFFLQALLERGLSDVALGPIIDPMAVRACAEAGVGATFELRLGGKCGRTSGAPVDLEVEVMAVRLDFDQECFGTRNRVGDTVWLRHAGLDLVVSSFRTQAYGLDLFTGLGIDLMAKRLIVVKSSHHYEATFGRIADHVWSAVSPGALSLDFGRFAYSRRDGAYFPRVDDPWSQRGAPTPLIFESRSRG